MVDFPANEKKKFGIGLRPLQIVGGLPLQGFLVIFCRKPQRVALGCGVVAPLVRQRVCGVVGKDAGLGGAFTRWGSWLYHRGVWQGLMGRGFACLGGELAWAGDQLTRSGRRLTRSGVSLTRVGGELALLGGVFARFGGVLAPRGEN